MYFAGGHVIGASPLLLLSFSLRKVITVSPDSTEVLVENLKEIDVLTEVLVKNIRNVDVLTGVSLNP